MGELKMRVINKSGDVGNLSIVDNKFEIFISPDRWIMVYENIKELYESGWEIIK